MCDPALGLAARRGSGEECLEVLDRGVALSAAYVKEREAVMRPGQCRFQRERLPVTLDRLLEPIHACKRDREILERLRIVRFRAKRQPVRCDRGVKISRPLQRQRLVQVVEALRFQLLFRPAAKEAAQPGHARRGGVDKWSGALAAPDCPCMPGAIAPKLTSAEVRGQRGNETGYRLIWAVSRRKNAMSTARGMKPRAIACERRHMRSTIAPHMPRRYKADPTK